ncbi:RNA polymerase sigma-70 factor, ECF subfamily [Micromonospora phaseoli]|uniref:RNA polymerase sigma-70 factor, ECF subfamily n=1 Tax=Micromonospora phaseoli TaxID=1144548 RepID=A0A1H6V3C4_9ACTN|nr:sigma-70 family RNA polymerase sigma factor [Micromonospora phaseoli]PZV99116.1 RNA polymerase sigma-70 factor (ECF subfamily) [Micromonospora phaseoli]GIJ78682.1 RNA polymerase sigma24 factor [Micromonospora phaseoli]SEI94735.1 RNA polymerase sigma-70 factor, ECF subfamily [Micromonospora phaseoli]
MRDAEEFDAFYAASAQRVLGHLSAMIGSRADAEDAVAEAYARAWDRWSTVRECDSPEAWVRRVAYRLAVSAWRKTVNRLRAHRREIAGQQVEASGVDHVAVVSALRRIPADQRRVVVLHHLVGLSVAEIAVEVDANANTVKTWLARGRRALAAHLTDDDDYQRTGGGNSHGA